MYLYVQRAMTYFSQHVILGHFAHALGGFGLALLLQHYLKGNAFLPAWVGWLMVMISAAVHIKAFMS